MEPGNNKKEYPSAILLTIARISHDINHLHLLGIHQKIAKRLLINFHHFFSNLAFLIFTIQPSSQTYKIRADSSLFLEVTLKAVAVSQIHKTNST
jgi:hypothetical protein